MRDRGGSSCDGRISRAGAWSGRSTGSGARAGTGGNEVDYRPRPQFTPFHERTERFACIVTHRRAGKTVACIHDLQAGACDGHRFGRVSPISRRSSSSRRRWPGIICASDVFVRGLRAHRARERAARRLSQRRAGPALRRRQSDALRGIYLDGIVLDEYADMDPRVWSEIIRPALADRQGWACSSARRRAATRSSSCGGARNRRRAGSR